MDSNVCISAPDGLVLRALVADDDADMLDVVASLLRQEGFVVGEAATGAELLGLVRDGWEANLMIVDVQMPGISGLEVLSHMRTHHPRVPVILMSAFATNHLRQQALDSGAAAVLTKPFSAVAIRELVARHARRD